MPIGYCTREDIITRFGQKEIVQLTTDSSTDHSIDNVRLDTAIDGAEAEINFWVGQCYALPLDVPAPDIVREWAILMSRYKLYTQIRLKRGEVGQEDHQSRRDYTDSIDALKKVCKAALLYPDGEPVLKPESNAVSGYAVAPREYPSCACNAFQSYGDYARTGWWGGPRI